MTHFSLPAKRKYTCVDLLLLDDSVEEIKSKFRTLLRAGAQNKDLPEDMRAAGQYLNKYDFTQRGMFGTAAAILTIAASPLDERDVDLVESLIRYCVARELLEPTVSKEAVDVVRSRLAIEKTDAFKTADMVYSLASCPSAVTGREALLSALLDRLRSARRPSAGWSVDLRPAGECDLLATAHVVRALAQAGVQPDAADLRLLSQACLDDTSGTSGQLYVRSFALLVLVRLDLRRVRRDARRAFRGLLSDLDKSLNIPSEANYEYTIGARQYYVRIPWQLYLIEACAWLYPWTRFVSWRWQRYVLSIIEALDSPHGFVYEASGSFESTRTHAVVSDTLQGLRDQYSRSQYLGTASTLINSASRLSSSRPAMITIGGGAVGLAGYSAYEWLGTTGSSFADVAPNFIASAVTLVLQYVVSKLRR